MCPVRDARQETRNEIRDARRNSNFLAPEGEELKRFSVKSKELHLFRAISKSLFLFQCKSLFHEYKTFGKYISIQLWRNHTLH